MNGSPQKDSKGKKRIRNKKQKTAPQDQTKGS